MPLVPTFLALGTHFSMDCEGWRDRKWSSGEFHLPPAVDFVQLGAAGAETGSGAQESFPWGTAGSQQATDLYWSTAGSWGPVNYATLYDYICIYTQKANIYVYACIDHKLNTSI